MSEEKRSMGLPIDWQLAIREVASYRTGKDVLMRIYADGVGTWTAGDMERLYEQIGLSLKLGMYDDPALKPLD